MNENNDKNKKFEESLKEVFREDVSYDATFKKNLDKLVENTINAKKLEKKSLEVEKKKNRSFFEMIFHGAKWQMALLTSFFGMLLMSGLVFAAVPSLREKIIPTKGTLSVYTDPTGAEVFIKGGEYSDYTSLGATPISEKLDAGDYLLEFRLEEYEIYSDSVKIKAGESTNIEVVMKQEKGVLEQVTEWKQYTNLQKGFEFIYPLDWEVDESQENKLIVKNGESRLVMNYPSKEENIQEVTSEISIDEKNYYGYKNSNGWSYSLFDRIESENNSQSVLVEFYTNNREHIKIYDHLNSNIVVYDVVEEEESESSLLVESERYKITLPKTWMSIISEEDNERIFKEKEGAGEFYIKYSPFYFQMKNEMDVGLFENKLDNYNAQKYCKDNCSEKVIYEFPERIFAYYEVYDDTSVQVINEILDTLQITKESEYINVEDHQMGYELTLPTDKKYQTITSTGGPFEGVTRKEIELDDTVDMRFYNRSDIETLFEEYKKSFDSEYVIESYEVRISGRKYYRNVIFRKDKETQDVYLETAIYSRVEFSENVSSWDGWVEIMDVDFLIILNLSEIQGGTKDELLKSNNEIFSLADAISGSITFVN